MLKEARFGHVTNIETLKHIPAYEIVWLGNTDVIAPAGVFSVGDACVVYVPNGTKVMRCVKAEDVLEFPDAWKDGDKVTRYLKKEAWDA